MRDSTPDAVTGEVCLDLALAAEAIGQAPALVDVIETWYRAIALGFFGDGGASWARPLVVAEGLVNGCLRCERLHPIAFAVLTRMLARYSRLLGRINSFRAIWNGRPSELLQQVDLAVPQAERVPFAVECSDVLNVEVRVGIEFVGPLDAVQQTLVFGALDTWDQLVAALGDDGRLHESAEYQTRLMDPSSVEHLVDGYFAPPEAFDLLVHMGVRLHQSVPVSRMLFE